MRVQHQPSGAAAKRQEFERYHARSELITPRLFDITHNEDRSIFGDIDTDAAGTGQLLGEALADFHFNLRPSEIDNVNFTEHRVTYLAVSANLILTRKLFLTVYADGQYVARADPVGLCGQKRSRVGDDNHGHEQGPDHATSE